MTTLSAGDRNELPRPAIIPRPGAADHSPARKNTRRGQPSQPDRRPWLAVPNSVRFCPPFFPLGGARWSLVIMVHQGVTPNNRTSGQIRFGQEYSCLKFRLFGPFFPHTV